MWPLVKTPPFLNYTASHYDGQLEVEKPFKHTLTFVMMITGRQSARSAIIEL